MSTECEMNAPTTTLSASLLGAQHKSDGVENKQANKQARLLCLWARHLTG